MLETIVFVGAVLVIILFVGTWAALKSVGLWSWSRKTTWQALSISTIALVIAAATIVALLGPTILFGGLPVLIITAVFAVAGILVVDMVFAHGTGSGASTSQQAAGRSSASSSWESLWSQFRHQSVPRWMQEALIDRSIVIDGESWIVNEKGQLVPAAQATPDDRRESSFWNWLRDLLE